MHEAFQLLANARGLLDGLGFCAGLAVLAKGPQPAASAYNTRALHVTLTLP